MKIINHGFTFNVPNDWQDRSMISFAAQHKEGEFVPNIFVIRQQGAAGQNLEELARAQLTAIKQSGAKSFESLSFETDTINDFLSCEMIYRFEHDGQLVQQTQTLILAQDTVFAITATALDSQFAEYQPKFRAIIKSFRVFDPENIRI